MYLRNFEKKITRKKALYMYMSGGERVKECGGALPLAHITIYFHRSFRSIILHTTTTTTNTTLSLSVLCLSLVYLSLSPL